MMPVKITFLCCLLLLGCATGARRTTAEKTLDANALGDVITVTVITAADNVTRLPGVHVAIIRGDGTVADAGTTDAFGEVTVRRSMLGNGIGVMFCHPVFYCGILTADELRKRSDITIALATQVIR